MRAFNLGVVLQDGGTNATLTQNFPVEGLARPMGAVPGSRTLSVACSWWQVDFSDGAFGTAFVHAMGHAAGYEDGGIEHSRFQSVCAAIGEPLCLGHCKEWKNACNAHGVAGGEACGLMGVGCRTTCVDKMYCNSLPERAAQCLGFEKKHSRYIPLPT